MAIAKFLVLFMLIQGSFNISVESTQVVTYDSELNKTETFRVSSAVKNLHVLIVNAFQLYRSVIIRLNTTTFEDEEWGQVSCPVVFTLTQSKSTRSWALPLQQNLNSKDVSFLHSSEFTLCLEDDYFKSNGSLNPTNIEFLVLVSTCSQTLVNYSLEFMQEYGFVLSSNQTVSNVEVSPANLHFYRFNFPEGTDKVVFKVDSEDEICMIAAVQSPWCRLLNKNSLSEIDSDGKASPFNAYWQEMTKLGVIPVSKSDFNQGVFIGFKVLDSDESCGTYTGMSSDDGWTPIESTLSESSDSRAKSINITVIPGLFRGDDYLKPVLYPIIFVLIIVVITTILYGTFNCFEKVDIANVEETRLLDDANDVEQTEWICMDSFLRNNRGEESLERVYLLIGAIGIFYGIPTLQLLYTYHKISESTGQTGLCYRNYLCSHRAFGWDDFNHIYSNICYVLLAIPFCIFVLIREKKVRALKAERDVTETNLRHGIVHQFGLFYALGVSFGLEGILSAMYHVCPTAMNFQFDTSFMFILAALTTIKIYQFRRPDPLCPHNTFGLLALISFINVGGIFFENNKIYEAIFICLQVVMLGLLSVYLYYVGYVKDENGNPITDSKLYKKCGMVTNLRKDCFAWVKPGHKTRLYLIVPLVIFNISLIIVQMLKKSEDTNFASYLIYVFAGNMMIYFMHYLIMKVYHSEACTVKFIQPCIYLIFALVLGGLGCMYFMDHRYDSDLIPAKSRERNKSCDFVGFYDTHDLWHVVSAGSIFFFYMALLTLDDGILHKERKAIVSF